MSMSHASAGWLDRLVDRVSRVRSRLDFDDQRDQTSAESRVLAAMLEQLILSPFTVISKGLNTKKLEALSPGLRSQASRRFGGAAGIASFILGEAIRPDRSELTDSLIDSVAQALLDPNTDHETVLLQLGGAYFDAVCDDPCLTLQTFAWLGARESVELRRSFKELYGSLGGRVSDGLHLFLESWGREPSTGITVADIATAITSLTEGLAMRTAVDPDSVPVQLPAATCVALIRGMTVATDVEKAHSAP